MLLEALNGYNFIYTRNGVNPTAETVSAILFQVGYEMKGDSESESGVVAQITGHHHQIVLEIKVLGEDLCHSLGLSPAT